VTMVCYFSSVWGTVYWGFVCCDCGVLLCVGMGYRILGGLSIVTVVFCFASVWCTVYWGVCVL